MNLSEGKLCSRNLWKSLRNLWKLNFSMIAVLLNFDRAQIELLNFEVKTVSSILVSTYFWYFSILHIKNNNNTLEIGHFQVFFSSLRSLKNSQLDFNNRFSRKVKSEN